MHEILQQMPMALAMIEIGHTPRVTFVNALFTKRFGYMQQNLPRLSAWLKPGSNSAGDEDYAAWFDTLPASEDTPTAAVNIVCQDGEIKTVKISASRLQGQLCVSLVDISHRQPVEAPFPAREEQFRLLTETMRDTLWSLDAETLRFNYLSPQAQRLLGYSIEELTAHPIDHFLPSPAQQSFKSMIGERYLEACNNVSGEIIYYTDEWEQPCKDGSLIGLEVISHFVHNPGTDRLEMLGVMRDITERKQAQDTLRLSEERHRLLAENARDVIWTMELDGSISYISPSIEKVRGFTVEEAMQQTIAQIHPPQSQAISLGYFQRLYEALAAGLTPDSFRGELEYWCKDGSTFWTEVMAYPILHPDGSFAQILGVTRDISERKRYELQLQQARIEAEKAAQAKSDFLANMSHEIRSPMNAIMGLTELVMDAESTAWKREYLNSVQNASKTLLSLINDILDYSKIEAGHLHFEHSKFLLSDVIGSTLELFKLKFDEKGLKLITELDTNLPQHLIGDSLRLGQILNNLINNAIKFTEKGEIRIIVKASAVPDFPSKTKLLFSVQDTGIGISARYMPQLFSPFTQAETSISRRFGGTGLGLSIAKRLVDMMEGEISASSAEGQGSVFSSIEPIPPMKHCSSKTITPACATPAFSHWKNSASKPCRYKVPIFW